MSVARLVEDLQRLGDEDVARGITVAERIIATARGGVAFEGLPHVDGGYTRTCLWDCESFEVLAIRWAPGALSPIHDHAGQRCWLAVLEGNLINEDFTRCTAEGAERIACADLRVVGPAEIDARDSDHDLHRVANPFPYPAVSLHVYARPIRAYRTYDVRSGAWSSHVSTYDARRPILDC